MELKDKIEIAAEQVEQCIEIGCLTSQQLRLILSQFASVVPSENDDTIQKYTDRLATLKENRGLTVDSNTDVENEVYDNAIKDVAEFIRDLKTLK